MTTILRMASKGQVTIPPRLRAEIGIAGRGLLKASARRGSILLTPVVANVEYTPQQRRAIDARLALSGEDIKAGRTYGPFDSVEEMVASIKRELKARADSRRTAGKPLKPSR
jgi:bifunctional DNA-binding transcriptional regulator/antitoxin component of YhaV-PrlF toxin-antitoxin module